MKKFATFLLALISQSYLFAEVLNVPADYIYIQSAIDISNNGDSILVQQGTYYENIDYNGKAITILSTFYQDTLNVQIIENTIINGDDDGSCIVFESGEGVLSVIEGFTLSDGDGYLADPDDNGSFYTYGGGVYLKDSSPTLKNLIIKNNTGNIGGGGGLFAYNASPTLTDITFENNFSDDVGGAIYARQGSNLIINDCFFKNNQAEFGGACYLRDESVPIFTNVEFDSNIAASTGGAIVLKDDANAIFNNTYFSENISEGLGGGIYINDASPNLYYCQFSYNNSSSGGAFYIRNNSNPMLENVTLGYNSAGMNGDAIYLRDGSDLIIKNSIIWGHNDPIYFRDSGSDVSLEISYSNLEFGQQGVDENNNGDLIWGQGMLSSEPYFCNGPGEVFTLRENSSCLLASDINGLIGCQPSGCGPINTGPVWRVDNEGDDLNDGSLNTPFETIARAVNSCLDGDTIRLNPGLYTEFIDFEGKNIVFESTAFEDEANNQFNQELLEETILTVGSLGGTCLTLIGVAYDNSEIRGFTIKGGNSQAGGGVLIRNSNPILSHLIIEQNSSQIGGAIYIESSVVEASNILILDNGANLGGGIYVTESDLFLDSLVVESNIAYWGAGVYSENSNLIISNSKFISNSAYTEGGSIYQEGGEIVGDFILAANNFSLDYGGSFSINNGSFKLNKSTIVGNESNYGSFLSSSVSIIELSNSIVWGNIGEDFYITSNGVSLTTIESKFNNLSSDSLTISESGYIINWGDGNINEDPDFCDYESGNYSLSSSSVCATSSENGETLGAFLVECESVLSSAQNTSLPKIFKLEQNYPNPFNSHTKINYSIPDNSDTYIYIYDIKGRLVFESVVKNQNPGNYSFNWNGLDINNNIISSGIYIYRLISGSYSSAKQMVLLK